MLWRLTLSCKACAGAHDWLSYRRDSSTPIVSEARGGASFFFPLTCVRERSAGRRFGNKLTPRERRRVPLRSGTHASRRSTAAIFYTATALLGLDRKY